MLFAQLLLAAAAFVQVSAGTKDQIDAALSKEFALQHVPGAAIGIAQNGKLIYLRTFGVRDREENKPIDADTQFEIGSVTKQFTAAAILQLQEQGKLSIDDPLAKYLPSFPHASEITLRHLLNQVSGLANYTDVEHFGRMASRTAGSLAKVATYANQPLHFTPGTKWEYSNTNYYVLASVIEAVAHEPYESYVREHLFAAAGMAHSAFVDDESKLSDFARPYYHGITNDGPTQPAFTLMSGWLGGAGSIVSTIGDLAAWNAALASERIVNANDYALMTTPAKLANGQTDNYGMGLSIGTLDGHPSLSHHGGTAGSEALDATFPSDGFSIIVLENDVNGNTDALQTDAFEGLLPDAAAAANSASPGEDLAVRPRILHMLDETLHGAIPATELTPDFAKIATPQSQEQLATQFASLGTPKAILFRKAQSGPDGVIYTYRVQFASSAFTFIVGIDNKTNLISAIGIAAPQ